ncbi:GNAT family N-acetyltransferase [Ottowia thiooxydans]|uniref:GNAT family N-acetyltransferase n=1 Tax=Ottowia thiooxydans TaxID=219182 RepID=UPI001FE09FF7|nr:GNAT family N-acetyltransferase [Ottowia thiooxydans]
MAILTGVKAGLEVFSTKSCVVISIRPTEPNEWRTYRDVRLQALLDSPNAFGSTYEEEVDRTDAIWAARIAAAASSGQDCVLFARHRENVCGLVWCKLSAGEPMVANVFQMWVDPASRGKGAGRALLKAAIDWAERVGARRVCLCVTSAETPAMGLYLACGFRPAGATEPLRESSSLLVQPMSLTVGSASP